MPGSEDYSKDRLIEAIKELEVALKGTHFHDEIIHQSSSFERLEKEKRQDIISPDKVRTESAKIRQALLAILAELKEESAADKAFSFVLTKVNRKFGFYSKTAHIQVTIHAGAKDDN